MSTETVETVQQSGDEAALLVRTFDANLSADGDGRTIEGLVVPYNVSSRVSDPGVGVPYDESFALGAFRAATGAPNRVLLDFEHYGAQFDAVGSMGSLQGTLGWATGLEERPEGLVGQFRVGNNADGDKALELVNAGVLRAFSVAFKPLKSLRTSTGAMQRVKAHLDRVSLCRQGAYAQAQVLAVRTAPEVVEHPEAPVRFDSALAEGLSRWIEVPGLLRAAGLAGLLKKGIAAMATEQMPHSMIVGEMGSRAQIEPGTVTEILDGAVTCPPRERLVAFASVLGISVDSLIEAATRDGCTYG